MATPIQFNDLPEPLLYLIISLISDIRTRNCASLVSHRWRLAERLSRTSLTLRGHACSPFPNCFPSVTSLDISLLSPWGHPHRIPLPTALAFTSLDTLTLYSRHPDLFSSLVPLLPSLRKIKLVRWHQRPLNLPLGADIAPVFSSCPFLTELDLSEFYCWTEDVPQALVEYPVAAARLCKLNLLCSALAEGQGYRSSEIVDIAAACPNLTDLRIPCVYDPRCFDFVGDECLDALGSSCPRLVVLHLVDSKSLSGSRRDFEGEVEEAVITGAGIERLFMALPLLEDLSLDLCSRVEDARVALEALSVKCPRIKCLKLGCFLDVCRGAWEHLDGLAVCGGLVSLCIKNSPDLSDASLATIARGCRRLSRFEIHGCGNITESGMRKFVSMLRGNLVDVSISGCRQLDARRCLRALEPIRDRIERLHVDFVPELEDDVVIVTLGQVGNESDLEEEVEDEVLDQDESLSKRRKYSNDVGNNHQNGGIEMFFWERTWGRLHYLSLWVPVGEVLMLLANAGLESCPNLEEMDIKIEGDCRICPRPVVGFGLHYLAEYPQLKKLKLDCSEAIGYALTAPTGHMDLSLWERFFLQGISELTNLYELDYWPPQDKDVNQRCLSLPAAGLIQGCTSLRKLFIHGTAHEHFINFFLNMPILRDVQLREDYYPAPESDTSTEMRVASCSRFELALNNRMIPD